ncbi:hypothetical protein [Serpentinimonas maccroryi]|uniref:hypothetical protein n=1 Tax=Serpentinimonas maccroryi TaxID=1458426 RepID=UPI00203336BD|nr:hypothetical protein [Serpentinimonas maccroryi]MCM2480183.1 DNA-binding protein [Serpentinimonas maccroryi]
MKHSRPSPLPPHPPYPQTPETAHAWIRAHGVVVTELARSYGVPRTTLTDLMRGRNRGYRGKAHQGAVLLGLKPDPEAGGAA